MPGAHGVARRRRRRDDRGRHPGRLLPALAHEPAIFSAASRSSTRTAGEHGMGLFTSESCLCDGCFINLMSIQYLHSPITFKLCISAELAIAHRQISNKTILYRRKMILALRDVSYRASPHLCEDTNIIDTSWIVWFLFDIRRLSFTFSRNET